MLSGCTFYVGIFMKHIIPLSILFILVTSLFADQTSPPLGIQEHDVEQLAFTNATIVISPGRTIEQATLLIRDGRIAEVGNNVTIPEGVEEKDLSGMYIYPAFIDPMSSYGMPTTPERQHQDRAPKYIADRTGGSAWNEAIHSDSKWAEHFHPDNGTLDLLHQRGYAIVQSARLDGIFRGNSVVVLLRNGLPNDLILKPYSLPFLSFDKGSSMQEYPSSIMGSIALMRQTFLDAEWYDKARSAWKRNKNQIMPEYNSTLEQIAGTSTNPMIFDSQNTQNLIRGQRLANEFNLHFINIGSNHEYAYLDELKKLGIKEIILPLNFPLPPSVETVDDEAPVTLAELRHWNTAPSNAKLLDQNGISVAFTAYHLKKSDDMLAQVRKTIQRGFSPKKALSALTTIPANMCGISTIIGTLEKGKLANFLVCSNDLFNEKGRIMSVWVGGQENIVKPIPEVDHRGVYELTYEGRSNELHIEGSLEKLSGKIIVNADTLTLKEITFENSRLHFSVKDDTSSSAGILRFSGNSIADSVIGTVINSTGQRFSFVAQRIDTATSNKENNHESETDAFIASISHPNRSFGFLNQPVTEDILFKNATIWTSDTIGILSKADLLIIDGLIQAVGRDISPPKGVKVVDATGKHITAGIIDAHSHIAISGGVNEGTHAVTSEVRIGDVINPNDISIYRQLAGGVTTSLLLHGSANPIGGQTQVVKLRWGTTAEEMKFTEAAPTIKFALGENVKQSNWGEKYRTRYPQTRMGVEAIMRDAFRSALDYEQKRNVYQQLSSKEKKRTMPIRKDLQKETLLEVLHGKRLVHCHSYHQTEILMLIRLAEEFGFKVAVFTHILEGYKVAKEMALHGAMASSFSDWWAYKFEVYDAIPQSPRLMADAGLVVSINSDNAEMARRLNQEAAKSIMYTGMSQEEALKMVTINPAIQLRVDHLVGSLKKGKQADFVIWNDNPLSVYAKVEQTWIEGKRYFDVDIDRKMREQMSKEKNELIQLVLNDSKNVSQEKQPNSRRDHEYHCDDVFDYWKTQEVTNYVQ